MNIVILGLSITSSWGNGHATTYRGLVRQLAARGHEVLFLERDTRWYAAHRDLPRLPGATVALYRGLGQLQRRHAEAVRAADAVIVGSYVPQGIAVGEWVLATARGVVGFYDIDTPVTLAQLARGTCDYLALPLIPRYHLYLSFTGGPVLRRLEREFGSPLARPLYCSVDPEAYYPEPEEPAWDCGYLGTYSADRQPRLEELLLRPARRWRTGRFVVAGPQYPRTVRWPANVERIDHVEPAHHRAFYNRQRFTLNITRADMVAAGHSPSVRLFEAAACGVPIISDSWAGLEEFLEPGAEILVAGSTAEALDLLRNLGRAEAHRIGLAARRRILAGHTAAHRALQLEHHLREAMADGAIDAARILSA